MEAGLHPKTIATGQERSVMVVCETEKAAALVRHALEVDAFAVGAPLLGHLWKTIICPSNVGSTMGISATQEEQFLAELSRKVAHGGKIIWI